MKIKASSIHNLTDARYFAAWNVEWLGFALELGHPHYTRPQDVQEIKDWLVGPKIVGEFGISQDADAIEAAIQLLNLDAIQLGMFTAPHTLEALEEQTIFQEWVVEDIEELQVLAQHCATWKGTVNYFQVDLEKNGWSWERLQEQPTALQELSDICQQYPIILAISCAPESVEALLAALPIQGLSIQGGEEEKVGIKSFDDLDAIFEVLESMDLIGF